MSEIFTPAELRARFAQLPYITPYARIVALVDSEERLVELHEFHARGRCTGGAAWEVYHYARTSPLVLDARREGARNIFTLRGRPPRADPGARDRRGGPRGGQDRGR